VGFSADEKEAMSAMPETPGEGTRANAAVLARARRRLGVTEP